MGFSGGPGHSVNSKTPVRPVHSKLSTWDRAILARRRLLRPHLMTERTQHGSPEEDAAGERPRSRWGTIAAVAGAAVLFLAIVGAVTDMVIASGTEVRGGSSGGGGPCAARFPEDGDPKS